MALVQKDLKISKIKELFTMDLILPSYQRPYSWSVKASNTLFNDTFQAFKNGIKEYRLGSIILYKEEAEKYSIVDGQQRLTTLSILIYCLRYDENGILKEKYSELSDEKGILKKIKFQANVLVIFILSSCMNARYYSLQIGLGLRA